MSLCITFSSLLMYSIMFLVLEKMYSFVNFFFTSCIEIVVDSCAVGKTTTESSAFHSVLPVVIPYITVVCIRTSKFILIKPTNLIQNSPVLHALICACFICMHKFCGVLSHMYICVTIITVKVNCLVCCFIILC